jgi:hypothetical protein
MNLESLPHPRTDGRRAVKTILSQIIAIGHLAEVINTYTQNGGIRSRPEFHQIDCVRTLADQLETDLIIQVRLRSG